jgi:hypothetical protein
LTYIFAASAQKSKKPLATLTAEPQHAKVEDRNGANQQRDAQYVDRLDDGEGVVRFAQHRAKAGPIKHVANMLKKLHERKSPGQRNWRFWNLRRPDAGLALLDCAGGWKITLVGSVIARASIAGATAIEPSSIWQRNAAAIGSVRTVLGAIPLDDDCVADLQIAFLPGPAAERSRTRPFNRPIYDGAVRIHNVDVEVGMGIAPLDARYLAHQAHRLVDVELSGKRVMSVRLNSNS